MSKQLRVHPLMPQGGAELAALTNAMQTVTTTCAPATDIQMENAIPEPADPNAVLGSLVAKGLLRSTASGFVPTARALVGRKDNYSVALLEALEQIVQVGMQACSAEVDNITREELAREVKRMGFAPLDKRERVDKRRSVHSAPRSACSRA